jgi:uncharacterized protein
MDADWEFAIKHGDVATVIDRLDRGVNVNERDRYGQTGLMLAAHAGQGEVVQALLAHQVDLNVTAKFGLNALMLAVIAGHVDIAVRLVKAGTDLSARGSGAAGFVDKTAYDLAMERGLPELAIKLKPKL